MSVLTGPEHFVALTQPWGDGGWGKGREGKGRGGGAFSDGCMGGDVLHTPTQLAERDRQTERRRRRQKKRKGKKKTPEKTAGTKQTLK